VIHQQPQLNPRGLFRDRCGAMTLGHLREESAPGRRGINPGR
jgi:hypothetical protein